MATKSGILVLSIFYLSSCIGVDYVDDPIVGEKIIVSIESLALMIGQTQKVTAQYFNKYGVEEAVTVNWSSSSTAIATIDNSGTITSLLPGQALVFASFNEAIDTIRVTVVGDINSVAKVTISSEKAVLKVGETLDLAITVSNINDQPLSGKTPMWKSSNSLVVSVTSAGVATALANGLSTLTAEVDGVVSNSLIITVGSSRSGIFVKSGGYEASGTATLSEDSGNLILEFGSDFKTSFALGTFIYLSNNNSSGSAVKSNGLELQQITQSGAHTFNVSLKSPGVKLTDYKYVIILCKPATVIFGSAELK